MLTSVLVLANSSAAQRGLAALVAACSDLSVAARMAWEDTPRPEYGLILGELAANEEAVDLVEPFVLLCDPVGAPPGPGRAFLAREAEDEAVVCAMRAVLMGLSVLDPSHFVELPNPESDLLTPRELDVLTLLGEGCTNREIAQTLFISENTVKFHLSSVFSKLGVSSRAEAVTAGLRSGLLML